MIHAYRLKDQLLPKDDSFYKQDIFFFLSQVASYAQKPLSHFEMVLLGLQEDSWTGHYFCPMASNS